MSNNINLLEYVNESINMIWTPAWPELNGIFLNGNTSFRWWLLATNKHKYKYKYKYNYIHIYMYTYYIYICVCLYIYIYIYVIFHYQTFWCDQRSYTDLAPLQNPLVSCPACSHGDSANNAKNWDQHINTLWEVCDLTEIMGKFDRFIKEMLYNLFY